MENKKNLKHSLVYFIPWTWFGLFLLIPFLFIVSISFTLPSTGMPPFTSIINLVDNAVNVTLHLDNYIELSHYRIVFYALLNSLQVALITTVICILIGYPMALALA